MEIPTVGFVKVPVTDVVRAARWYRDLLGLREDFLAPEYGWGQFGTPTVPICIYKPGMGGGDRTPGGDTGIQLRVLDAAAWHARLSAAGGVEGPLQRGDDGTSTFMAKDPDGNLLQVAQEGKPGLGK